jgi:hypothetical protein
MTATAGASYDIGDVTVRMPVVVRDALSATATFLVPAAEVRPWLPSGLKPVAPVPGRALLLLSAIDYRDNDLGAYREVSVAVAVRRGVRLGTFIHRLPVDDEFSRAAGRGIWGFPKTVQTLSIEQDGDDVVGEWDADSGFVLRLRVRGGGGRRMSTTAQRAYTVIDGKLHETRFLMRGKGASMGVGGAELDLGQGEAADELRAAGLPKHAIFSTAVTQMQMRFDAPRLVE